MPAGTFETWRTARDGLRWIATPARSTGKFETWLTLRTAPSDLAPATTQLIAATGLTTQEAPGSIVATPGTTTLAIRGLPSGETLGALVVSLGAPPSGQTLQSAGIRPLERMGNASLSLAAAQGSATHHILSDWARMQHDVSDGG